MSAQNRARLGTVQDSAKIARVSNHFPAGYTLIELVVAMVIASVLIAIAVPSYMNYSLRAHRTDAKTALLDLASLEERYFSTKNQYSQTATDLGYASFPATIGPAPGDYQITVSQIQGATAPTATASGTPASYTLVATPINNQPKDTACASFTVTSTGSRTATASGGGDNTSVCWN
jgi:type IV pilus assembly protein PilE